MWRLSVDTTCIGSGSCTGVAPRYFALDEHRRSRPQRPEVEPAEAVLDAAASCPMEAIHVLDASTGEPVDY